MTIENTNATLFYRDGRPFVGKPQHDEKGKPYTQHQEKCSRCGGAGGSEKWAHTGWTCYQCGGSGKGSIVTDKLYTAEQLVKLNATKEKRDAKKAAAAAAKQAAVEAERNATRAAFVESNKEIFALAATLNDTFFSDMVAQCIDRVRISPAQIDLINRRVAETAQKAAAAYVGTIGERRNFTCTLEKFFDWSSTNVYPQIYKYCHIMRDENGNCIKYIGSKVLGGVKWEGQYSDKYRVVDPTVVLKFKATISAQEEYKGEKQTIVARPKIAEEN